MANKKRGNKITKVSKHKREDKCKKRSVKTKKRSYRKYKGGDTCENINVDTCICKDVEQRLIHKWVKYFDKEVKSNYWFDEIDNLVRPATWKPPC